MCENLGLTLRRGQRMIFPARGRPKTHGVDQNAEQPWLARFLNRPSSRQPDGLSALANCRRSDTPQRFQSAEAKGE